MVRINKGIFSQFAEKRPGKILIYDLDITLKTGIFSPAEILVFQVLKVKNKIGVVGRLALEVSKVKNRDCHDKIGMVGRYVMRATLYSYKLAGKPAPRV